MSLNFVQERLRSRCVAACPTFACPCVTSKRYLMAAADLDMITVENSYGRVACIRCYPAGPTSSTGAYWLLGTPDAVCSATSKG
jgi:hypothetical protein